MQIPEWDQKEQQGDANSWASPGALLLLLSPRNHLLALAPLSITFISNMAATDGSV